MRLLILLASALAYASTPINLSTLPDGYPSGRQNVPYGAYQSVMTVRARPYQTLLETLQPKIYGLAKLANDDEIKQSEIIYYLEHLLIGVYQVIANAPAGELTMLEREQLLYLATRLYDGLRHHAERLYEGMIREVDKALPGSTGCQQPHEIQGTLDAVYTSNCRSETPLTAEQRKAIYEKKKAEFLAGGGSLDEMKVLSPALVQSMGEISRMEYVVRPDREVWVTEGGAGHFMLAEGGDTLAAGQIVVLKDRSGRPTLAIVSNASGNYKPDLFSAERMGLRIHRDLGVPIERIVVTKGEPMSHQTFKVLSKARKVDPAQIKAKLAEMEAAAREILQAPRAYFAPTAPAAAVTCPKLLEQAS